MGSRLKDRLRAFMERYQLTRAEMAAKLRTPVPTFWAWLDRDCNPPACLLVLMDLLESEPRVREVLVITEPVESKRNKPRGKPFEPGNKYRFTPGEARANAANDDYRE